jgi:hypothetical protein
MRIYTITILLVVKRTLRRPGCRWVDNIKIDFGEIGWGDMD